MFLTEEDYKTLCDHPSRLVYEQSDTTNRERAERMAIAEIKAYLGSRYNQQAIFAAQGEQRNHLVVMWAMDIALYHLSSWLPGRMGSDIREKRYEKALDDLKMVAKGSIDPGLPPPADQPIINPSESEAIMWQSEARNNNDW